MTTTHPPRLAVQHTDIPGLLMIGLVVRKDSRGWFKENWQRAVFTASGLPDFGPVQQNISFNADAGVIRGLHAEPWDKYISIATGRAFGAWVDLRAGESFGRVVTAEIGPDRAVFVPRGVANAFQSLQAGTVYTYLVNDHWSAQDKDRYTTVNVADPALGIDWPIPLERAVLSDVDRQHPSLADITPEQPGKVLVLGAGGQLGRALLEQLPDAVGLTRAEADLGDAASLDAIDLTGISAIVNAAAFTAVEAGQEGPGRSAAWRINVTGVSQLARIAREHRLKLVHVSSDYVFDGTQEVHTEDEPVSPLNVYGQTKAAGEAIVTGYERGYVVRTSWVVGDGRNFVATMASLADQGVSPLVVNDQHGRLTFASDLADGIVHLLTGNAPPGIYHLTNAGPTQTWAEIAGDVFELCGRDRGDVRPVSTAEYAKGKDMAPRPMHSTLDLSKITATGYQPVPASERLAAYVRSIRTQRKAE